MAEIIIYIGTKIAEYLFDPTVRQATYLFCFKKFVESLEKDKKELESMLQSVKERVEDATRKTEEIMQPVKEWVSDVENILQEVQKLEESMEAGKSCFNVPSRYSLAKQMANKTQEIIELKSKSKFDKFSHPTELEGIKYFSSKGFMYFKSTEFAFNKVLEALKDSSSHIIGLHGMGGCGKTSLAKEVGKKVEELKLFDKVLMAVVSQPLNVRNIQGQIADQLGLELKEETEYGRAQRLSKRLENERFLIIFDDVWGKLDFEVIGIPSKDDSKSPIVLLTTRLRRVCFSMDCQSIIELSLLSEEEAWVLFKLHANISDDYAKDMKDVARKVAQECKGLPIAIVTLGSTLKGKSFKDWKLARWRLKESQPMDIEEGLRSPYACVQLSYDNLRNQVAKSLFLLCSLFPEDFEIHKEDLFRYGKGILQEPSVIIGTMEKARSEMDTAINMLIDSSLLMPMSETECVKMHDLVRDVALWIASKEDQVTIVFVGMDPRIMVEDDTIKDKARISFWELKNGQLPDQLSCSKLDLLLHSSNYINYQVPNGYLKGMTTLKVLAFREWDMRQWDRIYRSNLSIPQSIESLTNLRTLCLEGYQLGDISAVGNLKGLEILNLCRSSFKELPDGIAALKKLKLLDLFRCSIEENNPYQVIGRCWQLEELYITTEKHYSTENVSLPSLQRYIISDDSFLQLSIFSPIMDRISKSYSGLYGGYGIHNFLSMCENMRVLWIDYFSTWALSSFMKDLLRRAESVHLWNLEGSQKNIIPSMDPGGMNQLVDLSLHCNSGIECLVDMKTNAYDDDDDGSLFPKEAAVVFSKLVYLDLNGLSDLEQVFRDPSSCCSLNKLQELMILRCGQLYSISFPRNSNLCNLKILRVFLCKKLRSSLFTPRIAQTLALLEELEIFDSSELKHIIGENDEEDQNNNVDDVSNQGNTIELEINLPALRKLRLGFLPNLMEICPKRYLLKLPNLKELKISQITGLPLATVGKMVIGSHMQQGHIIITTERGRNIFLVIDTSLNEWCNQEGSSALQVFLNFERLELESSRVEGIFQLEGVEGKINGISTCSINQSNLNYLSLYELSELRFIWNLNGPSQLLSLQKLRQVKLSRCPKLKSVFHSGIVRCLPKLKQLTIWECDEMEEIISSDSEEQECYSSNCPHHQVCLPELNDLRVHGCNKLKCLFSDSMACHFPQLRSLEITSCSQIEQVFGFKGQGERGAYADNDGQPRVVLPKLEDLSLKSLPNFTQICSGFQPPFGKVLDCPKYKYISSTSTSART